MAAKPLGVRVENDELCPEDVAKLAKEQMFVRIDIVNNVSID